MVLDNTPLKDIIKRLQETYRVDIQVSDEKLLERCLTGSIENSSLQVIIDALAKALQVTVQCQGKTIIFGGDYNNSLQ